MKFALIFIFLFLGNVCDSKFQAGRHVREQRLDLVETIHCIFCTRSNGFFAETHRSLTKTVAQYLDHKLSKYICVEDYQSRTDYGYLSGYPNPDSCEAGRLEKRTILGGIFIFSLLQQVINSVSSNSLIISLLVLYLGMKISHHCQQTHPNNFCIDANQLADNFFVLMAQLEAVIQPTSIHHGVVNPKLQQYVHNFQDLSRRHIVMNNSKNVTTEIKTTMSTTTTTDAPTTQDFSNDDPSEPIVPLFKETNAWFLSQINRRGNAADLEIPHRMRPIQDAYNELFRYNITRKTDFNVSSNGYKYINIIV